MKKKAIVKKDIKDLIAPGWKVDKIKFNVVLRKHSEVENLLKCLELEYVKRSDMSLWETNDFKQMKYNFSIPCGNSSVYVGCSLNTSKELSFKDSQRVIRIEYNPQKVDLYNELPFLNFIQTYDRHRIRVMSFDMAYDIFDIALDSLEVVSRHGNELWANIGRSKTETMYRGAKGENGHIKIYDKVKEVNKSAVNDDGSIDETKIKYTGTCSRIEITVKVPSSLRYDFMDYGIKQAFLVDELTQLPIVNIKLTDDNLLSFLDAHYDGKDFVYLLNVHMGFVDKFKDNRTKKKYKDMYNDIKKVLTASDSNAHNQLEYYNKNYLYNTLINYLVSTFKGDILLKSDVVDIENVETNVE